MIGSRSATGEILGVVALAIGGIAVAADTKADQASVAAITDAWVKAYNASDASGLVALYAEDAVLNPPGAPAARGHAAMRAFFAKDTAETAAAGSKLNINPARDHGISGDLAWEWGTFKFIDKAGATIDTGKYVTVYKKTNGKWLIIRDIWNTDNPAPAPAPAAGGPPVPGKK